MEQKEAIIAGAVSALVVNVVIGGLVFALLHLQGAVEFIQTGSETHQSGKTISVVSEESRVVDVVDEVNPAVVAIVLSRDVPVVERFFERRRDPRSNLFEQFFGFDPFGDVQVERFRENGTRRQEVGGGSGFFISEDGFIVTNAHVLDRNDVEYTVFTNDGSSYPATVVAADNQLDIALLKIDGGGFDYLTFGDSDEVKLGQSVIAIGNALSEFRNTVSVGVVSGLSRSIVAGNGFGQSEQLDGLIQTDAAINPGNSGGPLLDLHGEVIGVNVAVAGGSENIGFSLASNTVKTAVESMKENGRVIRPYLGVLFAPIDQILQEKNDLPYEYGALILRGPERDDIAVVPGSPADKADLEEYDIILEVDGVRVDASHSLPSLIVAQEVGTTVELLVWHNGEERTISVTLEEFPQ